MTASINVSLRWTSVAAQAQQLLNAACVGVQLDSLYALRSDEVRMVTQVEHPVSEMISQVNIPSCQVMVGMGVPLHRIPDVRRMFGLDPAADTAIDFEADAQIPPQGARPVLGLGFQSRVRLRVRVDVGVRVRSIAAVRVQG